jgi:hypothetical protein
MSRGDEGMLDSRRQWDSGPVDSCHVYIGAH